MAKAELNFFEKAISTVGGARWAFNNAFSRLQTEKLVEFGYDGPEDTQARGSSGKKGKNASAESWRINRNRYDLMWDARDMERNSAFVRGSLDRMEEYTCGQISYESRTGDSEIDQIYEDYFHDWCARADITGRHRFRELLGMAYRGWKRDGEHGFIILEDGEEIRLQAIEADRIGSPDQPEQSEWNIGGIKINDLGQIIGYEIYNCSRQSQYTFDQEVTPEKFIHLFKATRPSQYHGISAFAQALPDIRDIHEVFALEKQAMKFASMFVGFIRRKDGPGGLNWSTQKAPYKGDPHSMVAQAAMVRRLADGEDITFPNGTLRPSGSLMEFIELLQRRMAQSLNLPYGFLFNMAELGGVTARIDVALAMRTIRQDQKRLEEVVLNRVRNEVLEKAIAYGHVPAHPNWKSGKWNFGARITGDTGHDTQAKITKMLQGLGSASAIVEEDDGGSILELYRQIAREVQIAQDVAKEYNVPVEMITGRWPQATAMLASMNTPPAPPPMGANGMIAQMGDKPAQLLINLLEKVSVGEMERESAVQQVITVFGLDRRRAEMLVPDKALPQAKPGGDSAKTGKKANKP